MAAFFLFASVLAVCMTWYAQYTYTHRSPEQECMANGQHPFYQDEQGVSTFEGCSTMNP